MAYYGTGNWGLPEFGVTENAKAFVGGLFGQAADESSYNSLYNAQQSTGQIPTNESIINNNIQQDTQDTGGNDLWGGTAPGNYFPEPPMETPEGQPEVDWDAIIAPALNAYDTFAGQLGNWGVTQEGVLGQETDVQKQQLADEEARRTGIYNQNRSRETSRTRSAIDEARRNAAEMQQGLQARYGGTTGTGAFVGELMGRDALRNISENRTALQYTLGQIGDAEESLKREVTTQKQNLDMQLSKAKQDLRQWLMSEVNKINMAKGELESGKAEMKLNAMNDYRTYVAEVNARNAAFKQDLFTRYEESNGRLKTLKDSTVGNWEALMQQFTNQYSGATGPQTNASNLRYTNTSNEEDTLWDNTMLANPSGY